MCIKVEQDAALCAANRSRIDAAPPWHTAGWNLQQQDDALLTARLEDVARASGDWAWETDRHHRYSWVHGAALDVRPPTIGELIPAGLVVNWLGEAESPQRDFHAVLRQGEPFVRLVTEEQQDGRTRYMSRSAVPLFNADGSLHGYRGSARDVTQSLEAKMQLWRRDEALRLAMEQAQASSQAKSVLVSKVGHELRTPLNAIVGLAQLIQMRSAPADKDSVERWIAQIAKTGWHMVDVLDMLMELGRAGAVSALIANQSVNVVEVARDAMHLVERQAQARSVKLALDGRSPVLAMGDRRGICQVVVNLLSNAIKYNRAGGSVRMRITDADGEHEQIRIDIEDTGPGLNTEQMGRLFRPFDRLGAESSDVEGHGLGLLICKELVASLRGSIEVQSTVGQGSTFSVRLPSARCPPHPIEACAGRPGRAAPEPRSTGPGPFATPGRCAA
jgi:signal transduction histidine kinase